MNPARQAVHFFRPHEKIQRLVPITGGNVNDSWQVLLTPGELFILQKLSPAVFPDPLLVMVNLERVTNHLHQELQVQGHLSLKVPQLLYSAAGRTSYEDQAGNHWRMLTYIDNSRSLTTLDSPLQAEEIGRLLGCFHTLLTTLDPTTLHDPLPGFHVTPEYLKQYDTVRRSSQGHARNKEEHCVALIEHFRPRADILERHRQKLSTGIIHADPKVGNFLFTKDSKKTISLIDLDTVMPGLLIHDLGDCLRSCCNSAGEEIKNTTEVIFDTEMFAAALRGYSSQAMNMLNTKDRELLIDATWLISFELGLRFFTDHLMGNQYFKTQQPGQNLQRALIQLCLAQSILKQRSKLDLLQQRVMMTSIV